MLWPAIVFGWPAAFSSIAITAVGLIGRRPWLVAVGAAVGGPFMFYLFGTPRFGVFAAFAWVCHLGAATALWRTRTRVAWLLFAPTVALTFYVALLVLRAR